MYFLHNFQCQTCDMGICECLRMSCIASWQNFANMWSPANLTITARTASKFCARSRSQSKNIFDLNPISWVITGIGEPWPECHCVFGDSRVTSNYFKLPWLLQFFPNKVPGRMHLNVLLNKCCVCIPVSAEL